MRLAQPGEWPAAIAPRRVELPTALVHRWRVELVGPGPRLAALREGLVLVDASGRAAEVDAREPEPSALAPWPRHGLPAGGFRPAYASDPVFVADTGDVSRWSPRTGPRRACATGVLGERVDAFGLPTARVILSSSAWPDGLRLVDEASGEAIWTLPSPLPRLLAAGDIAVGLRAGTLLAVDLLRGRIRWQRAGIAALAALVNGAVWAIEQHGDLVPFDLATGTSGAPVRLAARTPRGLLDPDGRLHVVGGALEAAVLDLRAGGRVEWHRELHYGEHGVAAPWPVVLTSDGRFLLRADGRLLELRPGSDDPPIELWRTDRLLVDAQPHEGHLYVLEEGAGRAWLHCLGAAPGSSPAVRGGAEPTDA